MIGLDKNTGIEITEATPKMSDDKAVPSYMGQGNHLYTTSPAGTLYVNACKLPEPYMT